MDIIQFRTFLKKIQSLCLGFHGIVLIKTYVELILTKPGLFLFSGYSQTDMVLESYVSIWKIEIHTTRCQPSNGWQCIPNVIILEHVESTYLSDFDFSSLAQIKIKLFWEKNWICGFLCYITSEDFLIDVAINYKSRTDIDEAKVISALRHKSKFYFKIKKKNQFFGFPCFSTCEDLSIDVSITDVGLILTKPGRFLFSG